MRLLKHLVSLSAILLLLADLSTSQSKIVQLPNGSTTKVPSDDQSWILVFECPDDCATRKLWIQQRDGGSRRLVRDFERSLNISWAPDSQRFFVNDFYGSNGSTCYVFDPLTLHGLDVASLLSEEDDTIQSYVKAGHYYVEALRWIDSQSILVSVHGHFDEPPARGFTLKYSVDLRPRVRKISQSKHEDP